MKKIVHIHYIMQKMRCQLLIYTEFCEFSKFVFENGTIYDIMNITINMGKIGVYIEVVFAILIYILNNIK